MHYLALRGLDLNQQPSGYEPDELPIAPPRYIKLNGWRWIRTTEISDSRFTVCPLWPLGNPSRTRTVNLLITNQLLCQLSHIGTYGTYRARTCDPLLVRQMLSQLS